MKMKYLSMLLKILRGQCLFNNVFITTDCTCRCVMCNFWKLEKQYMAKDTFTQTLNALERLGSYSISLTGGEPLLHPSYFDFVKQANKRGFYTNSSTNGTLLTEKRVRKIKEAGLDSIFVSIDSLCPQVAYQIRQNSRQLQQALNGMKLLKKYGIPCSAITIPGKHNIKEFRNIVIKMNEVYDVPVILCFPDWYMGTLDNNYDFTPEETSKFIDELISLKKEGRRIANSTTYLNDIKSAYNRCKRQITCYGGSYMLNVYWNGKVTPCFKKQNTLCHISELTQNYLIKKPCFECLNQCFLELSYMAVCIKEHNYTTMLKEGSFTLTNFLS